MIHIQLTRLEPAADGTSAEQRGFDGIKALVESLCGCNPLTDGGQGLPHTWSCTGSSDEILPVAGATTRGDSAVLVLAGTAEPTLAMLPDLTDAAAQLAHDLVEKVSQTR